MFLSHLQASLHSRLEGLSVLERGVGSLYGGVTAIKVLDNDIHGSSL